MEFQIAALETNKRNVEQNFNYGPSTLSAVQFVSEIELELTYVEYCDINISFNFQHIS